MWKSLRRSPWVYGVVIVFVFLVIEWPKGIHAEINRSLVGGGVQENVSEVVGKYFVAGMLQDDAKMALEKNGFRVIDKTSGGRHVIIGQYINRHWRYLGLFYEETRIILYMKDERIDQVEGWVFFSNGL